MSPCPQMRCGKGQGRACRCCQVCKGTVQAFPLLSKSGKLCLSQMLSHTLLGFSLKHSFAMRIVLMRRGHATAGLTETQGGPGNESRVSRCAAANWRPDPGTSLISRVSRVLYQKKAHISSIPVVLENSNLI